MSDSSSSIDYYCIAAIVSREEAAGEMGVHTNVQEAEMAGAH